MMENNKNFIKDLEKSIKTKINLIKDNNIAPPYFVLKTIESIKNRKKTNVIYDDVPKLADEDSKEANGNEKIKKNIKTKKIIDKKLVKKKPTKKIINNQDEEINKVETLIK